LPNFKGQSAFYTWLFRITVNVASDRLRQRGARVRAFGAEQVSEEEMARTMADSGASPADTATQSDQRRRIMQGLAALPDHHRTIIMLSDLEGLSYREIAEVLQVPMGTVMSRLHNARRRLRDVLGPLLLLLVSLLFAVIPGDASTERVVRFGARVVLATDGPPPTGLPSVAPPTEQRLQRVLPKIRSIFGYREYTWLERYRAEVPIGSTQRWAVAGGRQLEVTPQAVIDHAVRMRVRLSRGDLNEVTTDIQAGSGQPAVIGGPRYSDGVLIIIVWANANPDRR
jgi:RNA polymerase sigma factor (sigma-70 family)